VFSSLDYALKKGGYDPRFRCGHYDGKGRVAEWIKYQPLDRMKWSILTSGPYMEMLEHFLGPTFDETSSTYVFSAPVGDGAIPMIHLYDLGKYARWIFDHPENSAGIDLEIATEHVNFYNVAKAFTNVTGKKAIYKSFPLEDWLDSIVKEGASSASQVDSKEPGAMTWKQNFTGWFNLWRNSGGKNPVIARNYDLLDKILPNRLRSIDEWMEKVGYNGNSKVLLKDREDKNAEERFKKRI